MIRPSTANIIQQSLIYTGLYLHFYQGDATVYITTCGTGYVFSLRLIINDYYSKFSKCMAPGFSAIAEILVMSSALPQKSCIVWLSRFDRPSQCKSSRYYVSLSE